VSTSPILKSVKMRVASGFVMLASVAHAVDGPQARQVEGIFASLRSTTAPGVAVLVIQNGKKVFERGYGVTDLRTFHPLDSQTNFRLASVSKQFTAMAIMLLVHDGKLRYDDRLTDVFPDFPPYGKSITIRNLLNHTSGLQDYEDLMANYDSSAPDNQPRQIQDSEVLELLKKQKATKFPPGSEWAYSNSGYVVLGLVVQRVSGKPFADFLHDRIFAPVKMANTVAFQKGKNEVPDRCYGHTCKRAQCQQTDQSTTSATLGDGGVYSSLEDLAKWDQALRDHTLLDETEMQPALTPVKPPAGLPEEPDGKPAEYGFGWFLNPYKGHKRMWHYGETVGFRTTIQRFPDDGLTIIILSNRSDLVPRDLALKVADVYLTAK
jgi:CubicO group peptidase (beta-lactamase class C family)